MANYDVNQVSYGGDTYKLYPSNLVNETKLSNAASSYAEVADRVYPVRLDSNGKLAVMIPWTDNSLALGETSSTAYRGDRGKAAYDHASAAGSAFASGLYKITTNAEGHVTAATAVVKSDLTALGVLDGNFGAANAGKFLVVGNDGSVELQTLEDATGVDFSGIQPASGNSF